MAFSIAYKIPFVSFRSGNHYTVNVWKDGGGAAQTLVGAASPFVTQEDDDEDIFADIRTQSGYLRILSTEADALWASIVPATDTDTPVTLTVAGSNTPVWQGFIQSQTYGHELYGDPQELELPVMCALSALQTKQISTTDVGIRNFAYLLKYMIDEIRVMSGGTADTPGSGVLEITQVVVGGGANARQWLLKRYDWMNFIQTRDGEEPTARYDLYTVLEDMCRYWGWTARTEGQTLYLTNADDENEDTNLVLSYAALSSLAAATEDELTGQVIGKGGTYIPWREGAINPFVNRNNEESQLRGPNKAVVKADVNQQDSLLKFAPASVREEMGDTWTWQQGNSDSTGYFTTPTIQTFGQSAGAEMSGTSTSQGGFCRRQIFATDEQDAATKCDVILTADFNEATPPSQIVFNRWRNYGGGSLSLKGSLFQGAKQFEAGDDTWYCFFHIGIGETRETARWFQLSLDWNENIWSGWTDTPQLVGVNINGNNLNGFVALGVGTSWGQIHWGNYSAIPIEEGLSGKLFIDFLGCASLNGGTTRGDIADFEVSFSRDGVFIPSSIDQPRPRSMSEDRVSEREYVSTNQGKTDNQWNADCIFASDNNMEYGYGLLMNGDGTWMRNAPFNGGRTWPEQHLADRVTRYWQTARKKLYLEVAWYDAAYVHPDMRVELRSMPGTEWHPASISHDWREDITQLTLLEL